MSAKNEKAKRLVLRSVAGISKQAERDQREFEALVRRRRHQAAVVAAAPAPTRQPRRRALAWIALGFIAVVLTLFMLAGR